MKDWTKMGAGNWNTTGTQLDMFAGIEGDGYGTIALDELADEVDTAPAAEVERADGVLFGLALAHADDEADALFAVVAA